MKKKAENSELQRLTEATTKRRDFFATGMRCVIVGGIGSFAAVQEMKRRRLIGDPNCIKLETCSQCIELPAGCALDKAENFRAEQGEK